MAGQQQYLRFAWWNLNNFAHYDPSRAAEERWPLEPAEYATKCARVDAALRGLVAQHPPDLLGLCEITPTAAEELQRRLFPDYRLLYPDTLSGSTFQVAGLYRRSMGFRNRLPLDPVNVVNLPRTTRAMLGFDHLRAGHCVRFILCH